ncbi:hypothetical protein PRZ48_012371 [Zasmidium cellare]|uniref:Uncharacterized protein n=1 Tax=Zasmidium cellare TaxID=395010 RepID=A0ABR0E589_ZASCE|nr:hypothetical protein PRZ48_012371 [Zasmidium cellare]
MANTSGIILILGAGSRVGKGVAQFFAMKGYRVALVARSLKETDSTGDQLNIKADLAKSDEIIEAFTRVKTKWGIPNVVVYNAAAGTMSPPDDPFGIPFSGFQSDMNINCFGVFVAAQQAMLGFRGLPADSFPTFMSVGAGKSASAHMMMAATNDYKNQGYRFYFVDERKPDGSPAFQIDAEAHAKMFWELVQAEAQLPWLQTFVKGVGYNDFGPYEL